MRPQLGYLSAMTLTAVLFFATNIARAAQSAVNTGNIVCAGAGDEDARQTLTLLQVEDGSTIYLSFRAESLSHDNPGSYFGLELDGDANGLFIGKPSAGKSDQYVLETAGGGGQVTSGIAVNDDETVLIVVKAVLQSGNDTFTMYVNPGKTEPMSGTTKTDLDIGSAASALYLAGSYVSFCVDQIRIGNTYQDVTR